MNKYKIMFSLFEDKLPKDITHHITKYLTRYDIRKKEYKFFKSRYKSKVYFIKYNTHRNIYRK